MLDYKNLEPRCRAFIFELDNVLYPERDYMLQVYYLFSNFIEFSTGLSGSQLTDFFKSAYEHHGKDGIFDKAQEAFGIEEKFRENFWRLHHTAILPLKLVLYKESLKLLQEIVVDRKQVFIVTNGSPEVQLNKIRQIEWNGLESYLRVYYANEIQPKPEPDVLTYILKEHNLQRRDLMVIGADEVDESFAEACGTEFINIRNFM